MGKKKSGADSGGNDPSNRNRQRMEDYLKRMASVPQAKREEIVSPRKLPPGVGEINQSMFNVTRLGIIQRALACELKWPCTFWGDVGRGKTYLAAAIYMAWPGSVLWMSYTEFCRHTWKVIIDGELNLIDGQDRPQEFSRDTWWDYVASAGLVVLDDIGVGEHREARNEAVKELLDRRANKPVILTSNLSHENMDRRSLWTIFDDRVMSRIRRGDRIELQGVDLRGVGDEVAA